MTMTRPVTDEDYYSYLGRGAFRLWNETPEWWRCPSCGRTKRQIVRWKGSELVGSLNSHHDHWGESILHYAKWDDPTTAALAIEISGTVDISLMRFERTLVCQLCNNADAVLKKIAHAEGWFSFSPSEIAQAVTARNNDKHLIETDREKINNIYHSVVNMYFSDEYFPMPRMEIVTVYADWVFDVKRLEDAILYFSHWGTHKVCFFVSQDSRMLQALLRKHGFLYFIFNNVSPNQFSEYGNAPRAVSLATNTVLVFVPDSTWKESDNQKTKTLFSKLGRFFSKKIIFPKYQSFNQKSFKIANEASQ